MNKQKACCIIAVCVFIYGVSALGGVFDISVGLTSLTFVTVGDLANVGELSGPGAGGHGYDQVCGGVDYAYNMGRFEITTAQYTEFLNAVAATDTYGLYSTEMTTHYAGCRIERSGSPGTYAYDVNSGPANRPVNFVNWGDAARFANWLHNGQPIGAQDLTTTEDGSYFLNGATTNFTLMAVTRELDATYFIPTEDEWYKAAYFDPTLNAGAGGYYDYPTGTDSVPSNDLIRPDPGNNANFYDGDWTVGSPYWTTVVGEFENSESPSGTFDQAGNVFEWTEAILLGARVIRGGAYHASHSALRASQRSYIGNPAAVGSSSVGFRIAHTPEPTSMFLLLAGAGMLLKRRSSRTYSFSISALPLSASRWA